MQSRNAKRKPLAANTEPSTTIFSLYNGNIMINGDSKSELYCVLNDQTVIIVTVCRRFLLMR